MIPIVESPSFISEKLIQGLLHEIVNKLEKQNSRRSLKVSNKGYFKELFESTDLENADFLWACIKSLDSDYGILKITLDSKIKPYDSVYSGAKLYFSAEENRYNL